MPATRRATGQQMEQLASRYLRKQGLQVLENNYYSKRGEIDLICRDGDTLVFVEVRFRKSDGLTSGAESITPTKTRRIIHTAQCYLQQHALWQMPCRFDVVDISRSSLGRHHIHWIANAFDTT